MDSMTPEDALREAISRAGSQAKLADICGCTQAAVSQMLTRAQPMLSAPFVLKVEAALEIPRWLLRPDFYPAPNADATSIAA
jgi:DNA-binding transcriptional regulator YdaS (Cro superfamily)